MKKISAILMALLMCVAIPTTAFAVSPIESIGGTDAKAVKGSYQAGSSAASVYSVDLTWGAMEFTYTDAVAGSWNPSTHVYDGAATAVWSWTAESNKITATNHSNKAVTAGLSFANAGGSYVSIAGEFYSTSTTGGTPVTSIPLATAVGTSFASAPTGTAYFRVTGGTISSGTSNATIGIITVTLS